jgi:hypothetical protein
MTVSVAKSSEIATNPNQLGLSPVGGEPLAEEEAPLELTDELRAELSGTPLPECQIDYKKRGIRFGLGFLVSLTGIAVIGDPPDLVGAAFVVCLMSVVLGWSGMALSWLWTELRCYSRQQDWGAQIDAGLEIGHEYYRVLVKPKKEKVLISLVKYCGVPAADGLALTRKQLEHYELEPGDDISAYQLVGELKGKAQELEEEARLDEAKHRQRQRTLQRLRQPDEAVRLANELREVVQAG